MNLIFFDIDGTLAIQTMVPQSAKEAIRRLRDNGDLVFICTGRPRAYAEKNFSSYADGFICSNGRLAFKGQDTLYDCPLTKQQIHDIISCLDKVQAGYVFFGENDAYYGGDSFYYKQITAMFRQGHLFTGIESSKVSLYNFDVHFRDISHRQQIEKILEGVCLLNPHGPLLHADMTVLGSDKGIAIKNVAHQLNVPIENTYAFGDGINDICMIEAAGHGIAMGNAVEELKEKAEYITTDIDEDGIWNGLKHYHLIG